MTQNDKVLQYCKDRGSITSYEAFADLRITRLSARIKDLRDRGYIVTTTMEKGKDGAQYARYRIKERDNVHD